MNTVETRKQDAIADCISMIRIGVSYDYVNGNIDALYKSDFITSEVHKELNTLLLESDKRKEEGCKCST